MEESEIKQLIKKGVDHNTEMSLIEFKDARGGLPKKIWKTVSSFSQRPGGGVIVFGINDNKDNKSIKVIGLSNIATIQENLGDLMKNMSFTIRPEYHIIEFQKKSLLVVFIPECPDEFKPCYYEPAGLPNGAYIRSGNTDRRATKEEIRRLMANSKRLKFDRTKAEGVNIDDLDFNKIEKLLIDSGERTDRKGIDHGVDYKILNNLGIADEFNNIKIPTLGGFLIFAKKNPQGYLNFSRYIIRCVKYKRVNSASDIIDRADINGTLDYQIDEMQKFILRNIKMSSKIVDTKRVDRYEYPAMAIREIIANAVIHRDYKITETYTQVNIFSDRLEIYSPGCLPPGVTVDNIKDAQVSRNEIIAARLKDLNYLEEYGRGIDIVFEKMTEWNLMRPIFKNSANSFKVILLGEELSKLNERQIKIWDYLQEENKITAKKCEGILKGIPRPTINYDLKKMQKKGLIRPKGESVGRYYEAIF